MANPPDESKPNMELERQARGDKDPVDPSRNANVDWRNTKGLEPFVQDAGGRQVPANWGNLDRVIANGGFRNDTAKMVSASLTIARAGLANMYNDPRLRK